MRFQNLVFGLVLQLVSCGNCVRERARAAAPDGARVAEVSVSYCGGATVDIYTDVVLRSNSWFALGGGPVVTFRGDAEVKLEWKSAQTLVVAYAPFYANAGIIRKVDKVGDVSIESGYGPDKTSAAIQSKSRRVPSDSCESGEGMEQAVLLELQFEAAIPVSPCRRLPGKVSFDGGGSESSYLGAASVRAGIGAG